MNNTKEQNTHKPQSTNTSALRPRRKASRETRACQDGGNHTVAWQAPRRAHSATDPCKGSNLASVFLWRRLRHTLKHMGYTQNIEDSVTAPFFR